MLDPNARSFELQWNIGLKLQFSPSPAIPMVIYNRAQLCGCEGRKTQFFFTRTAMSINKSPSIARDEALLIIGLRSKC